MKKIFHLSTCTTCKRILKEITPAEDFDLQDIKSNPISEDQLDELITLAGSAEALFSKKAQKYRELGLHERKLSEKEYKEFLLKEYTFLRRPVAVIDKKIFIGNSSGVIDNLKLEIGLI